MDVLKGKLESEHSMEKDAQKLIAYGKVMDDGKKLSEYSLKEGDFIVVMLKKAAKKKTTPAPEAAAEPTPAASTSTDPPASSSA